MIHPILKDKRLIPLIPYTKNPATKWGNDDKLTVKENATSYAVDCGRSNLVVIDCDVKGEANGMEAFIAMAQEHCPEALDTFTVLTPSGGVHFYYQVTNDQRYATSASKIAPSIDVRAMGGYVVAPGSQYKMEDGSIIEYTPEDNNAEILPLPKWVESILVKKRSPKEAPSGDNGNKDRLLQGEEIDRRNALNWALDKMSSSREGERNDTLNHVSYFMGRKRVDRAQAEQLIAVAVASELARDEAESTFKRAFEEGEAGPEASFSVITKEYQVKADKSFKDDPMDTEFYTHNSLSYNFWKKYHQELIFREATKEWYRYDSMKGKWGVLGEESMRLMLKTFLEDMVQEIRTSKATKLSAAVYKAQEKLWSRNMVDGVLTIACSDFLVTEDDGEHFDRHEDLINCANGVFDLSTGKLMPHDPKYYITKYIPVDLKLDATDSYCEKVLQSIHPEEKEFLQLFAGQSLTGELPAGQTMFFLLGHGANGKSTFINLMRKTSGDYGRVMPPSVFLPENGRENYALSDFEGIRAAFIEELPESKQLNSGAMKRVVGTDAISARQIYGKHRQFINVATVFLSCNRLPMIAENDDGTWRRAIIFTFPYSYKKTESLIKNQWDRLGDPMVMYSANKRMATAEAFLAWRVKGAMRWYENRLAEMDIPLNIQKTVNQWNENNDLLLAWFNECIKEDKKSFILTKDALDNYNNWALSRGNTKLSMRTFAANLVPHITFRNANAIYEPRKFIRKDEDYTQSVYRVDEATPPREAARIDSMFLHLAFNE